MTPEQQRLTALEKANQKRTEIKEYLEKINSGDEAIASALVKCDLPVTVARLLKAQKGWGPVKVNTTLAACAIQSGHIYMGCPNAAKSGRVIKDSERRRLAMYFAGDTPSLKPNRSDSILDRYQAKHVQKRMLAAGCQPYQIKQVVGL
jgi:hypothetical protein